MLAKVMKVRTNENLTIVFILDIFGKLVISMSSHLCMTNILLDLLCVVTFFTPQMWANNSEN
jgi:hypothetical protein